MATGGSCQRLERGDQSAWGRDLHATTWSRRPPPSAPQAPCAAASLEDLCRTCTPDAQISNCGCCVCVLAVGTGPHPGSMPCLLPAPTAECAKAALLHCFTAASCDRFTKGGMHMHRLAHAHKTGCCYGKMAKVGGHSGVPMCGWAAEENITIGIKLGGRRMNSG